VWSFSFCLFWAKFCFLHPSLCGWHHDNWKQIQSHSVLCLQTECCFSLKDLGDLNYFLRIDISTQPNGYLILTQSKYTRDILSQTNMEEAKPISSPKVGGCKLTKTGSEDVSDPTLYGFVVRNFSMSQSQDPKFVFLLIKFFSLCLNPLNDTSQLSRGS